MSSCIPSSPSHEHDVDMDDTTTSSSSSSNNSPSRAPHKATVEEQSASADQNEDDSDTTSTSSSSIPKRYEGRARKTTERWEPEPAAFAAQREKAKKLSLLQLQKDKKEAEARKKQDAKETKAPTTTAHPYSSLPPEPDSPLLLPLHPPDMPFADFALPADLIQEVQSEPPPKYRLLRQNYYSDPSLRPRTMGKDDDVPPCSCRAETGGCNFNCMNRQLFMECPVGRCPTLKEGERFCANMVIQERRFAATEVFRTRERGWALRTKERVGREEMLIEYTGEVVSMEEAQGRMKGMTSIHDYYFAALEGELILDAGPMGSEARFANHSCAPNCVLQKWTAGGEPHIILVAKRGLEAGEEVTYNYQLDTTVGLFGQQVCKCGAKNCSGLIGRKPQGGGGGVGGREGWRERAGACLAMRAPGLEAVERLVVEEEGREGGREEGGVELEMLREKAAVARAWISRWRGLMGGWVEGGGEEEVKEEEKTADADDGGEEAEGGGRALKKAKTTPLSTEATAAAAAAAGKQKDLIEFEDLSELISTIPKDIRFKEATEARQLLAKAKQARATMKVLYEASIKGWTPPSLPYPSSSQGEEGEEEQGSKPSSSSSASSSSPHSMEEEKQQQPPSSFASSASSPSSSSSSTNQAVSSLQDVCLPPPLPNLLRTSISTTTTTNSSKYNKSINSSNSRTVRVHPPLSHHAGSPLPPPSGFGQPPCLFTWARRSHFTPFSCGWVGTILLPLARVQIHQKQGGGGGGAEEEAARNTEEAS